MPKAAPCTMIAGVGAYVPEGVITNRDLERRVDTSDAWITERTGIRERRVVREGENASDMALVASKRALEKAGIGPQDLDMIIVGTVTGDMPFPACAAFLQHKLGARTVPSFDISAACAGFLFAVAIGDQFIRAGAHRNILVVGVELLSRIIDWDDRTTCILFGDGAGAAVLRAGEGSDRGVLSTKMYTDGSLTGSLCLPAGGSCLPITEAVLHDKTNKVHMNGRDVFKVAVRNLASASEAALTEAGLTARDIDWVVPHQANVRIINQVASRLEVPMERYVLNIDRYGNTSSASIPIALAEGLSDGRIQPGHTVLMCALGAGISWGSAVVRF
jgi:3-oxoacyl-[acyl-carrier-protein] synthase III